MGYYTGDFYAVGDPGIGSFFAGLAKKAVGFIPGVGPAISAGLDVLKRPGGVKQAAVKIAQTAAKHPVLSAAGAAGAGAIVSGATSAGVQSMLTARMGAAGVPGMKGFHMSKGRGGRCPSSPHMVRNRRMRVTNPKALRRAIRRASGFAKLAMRTIHIVHPKKKGRFGGFRKRVRRG